ncbi:hypothetical protein ACFQX7_22155 [Luedemannella flava]
MTTRGRAAGWWVDVLMVAGFAATTALLALPAVLNLDLWVRTSRTRTARRCSTPCCSGSTGSATVARWP